MDFDPACLFGIDDEARCSVDGFSGIGFGRDARGRWSVSIHPEAIGGLKKKDRSRAAIRFEMLL
jgi:hypothetical protein